MNTNQSPEQISPLIKFYGKLLILALPFIPLIAIYFICDPDMILKKYKRYDLSETFLNEGHVGWQNYLNNRDSIPYNSFIMGNSCIMAFKTDEWEKYLPVDSKAVVFFENSESMAGICQKIKALDEEDAQLDHLLIVIDAQSLSSTIPSHNTNRIFSYKAAGISYPQYLMRNLQAFLMPEKCLPFLEYKITGKFSPRMKRVIVKDGPTREPFTNNFLNPREREISKDGESYWEKHKEEFCQEERQPGETERQMIFDSQLKLLRELKYICNKHSTKVTLIVGPDFYQKRMHQEDLKKLQDVFGIKSVFDFTGVNQYTADYHNYYEPGHYRPILGSRLLKYIYNQYPEDNK